MKASEIIRDYSVADTYQKLAWSGSFDQYLDKIQKDPRIIRNAYQRVYDMVIEAGFEETTIGRKKIKKYNFFNDMQNGGKDAIFGIEAPLARFVDILRAAALGFGPQKRVLLLHGPVGSAKSTIARLLKKGLEEYSKSDAGVMYSYEWFDPETDTWVPAPMQEEPLKLIPEEFRASFIEKLFGDKELPYPVTTHLGDLNPSCRKKYILAMEECGGDWHKMIDKYIRVKRLVLSEKDRVGIGTYQPKDEKSQDATELTGDINYRLIAKYGSDSDPRAFNFDGEFNVANRGIIEFIEILKLETAFLYDLLGATQEKKVKPRKFALTDIDEVIIGHTNNPEYRRLQGNELMEAFKDRTVKVDVPYNLVLAHEIEIYKRDFGQTKKHVAPHTLTVASMWAILTRLVDPGDGKITLMQKLKLYDGKALPGFNTDNVQELREEGAEKSEGMKGISPRFIQDKISNALASPEYSHVNPFIVLNEIELGLKHHTLITNAEMKERYNKLLAIVKEEYEDIVKNEVQRAIAADEEQIARLCANYIDNVKAFTQREKIRNKYTQKEEEPDEKLMRGIEEKIDIPESRKVDFRKELMNHIGALALEGKQFEYWTNERLSKGLEMKLFEDNRHTIKLNTLVTSVVDEETQQKIEVVKARLINNYGYNEESANDVLQYVASIFARGDTKSKD